MIKYKLVCKDCNNIFDSWFSSSKEYEKLKKRKYLNCHICNSLRMKKEEPTFTPFQRRANASEREMKSDGGKIQAAVRFHLP